MKFVMPRDRIVASVKGHAIQFRKGEPTHVPPELYDEVSAAGGVPEEPLPEEVIDPARVVEPSDSVARQIALFDAFEVIVLRARREDFTAGGMPHIAVVSSQLGWPVSAKERDLAWGEFKVGKDG